MVHSLVRVKMRVHVLTVGFHGSIVMKENANLFMLFFVGIKVVSSKNIKFPRGNYLTIRPVGSLAHGNW